MNQQTNLTIQMNIWNIIYLNCGEWYDDMIDHRSYAHNLSSCEIKAWKNSGLNGIRTYDLCNTGAVLHQLSYQANWELATLWVRNIPVEGEEYIEDITRWREDLYVICRLRSWKCCPRPQASGSIIFKFFTIRPTLSRQINYLFFPAVYWLTKVLFRQLCHWIGLRAVYKPFVKRSNEWTSY